MFKYIYLTICIMTGCISGTLYSKTIDLKSNVSQVLTNNSLWTLNATCVIKGTRLTNNKIKIDVLKNNGIINGKPLSSGQSTLITVKDKTTILVSAEAGTAINLVNLGTEEIQALCNK